jgi:hypothetical protein
MVPPVSYTDFTLPAGDYVGHLEITDAAGERLTYYKLQMTIEEDHNP